LHRNRGDRLERVISGFGQQPDTEAPCIALRSAFVVVAADYDAQRDELIRRFRIMAGNPAVYARSLQLQAGWEDALTDVLARRAGTDASDITPRLMAASALACMRSSLHHWMLTGHTSSLPLFIERCFDQLSDGLA